MPADSVVVAQAVEPIAGVVLSVLPYLTPWSAVMAGALWVFRAEVKVWLTSRSFDRSQLVEDVKSMRKALSDHATREEGYWMEYDQKLGSISDRTTKLEMSNVEFRIGLERNHEEVLRSLGETNASIKELTRAFMGHLERGKE